MSDIEGSRAIGHGSALARTIGNRCGALDGAYFDTTPDNGTRLRTPLETGVLSLLADERAGGFCLPYFGR